MGDYESISSEIQTYRIGLIHPLTLDNKQEGELITSSPSLLCINNKFRGSRNLVGISVYLCHSKQEELFVYYSM